MTHTATHPNFQNWTTRRIESDYALTLTEKAVMIKGEIVRGAVWFPLSCVNVLSTFEIEVPTWLLSKKGLNSLV